MNEASEEARKLRDEISAWNRGDLNGSLTELIDAALRRERNKVREECAIALCKMEAESVTAEWKMAFKVAAHQLRATIEPEDGK